MGIPSYHPITYPFTAFPKAPASERTQRPPMPVNPAVMYHPEATPTPVTEMLVDPITRERYDIPSDFDDNLLRLGPLDKAKLSLEQSVVGLPKSIYRGLKGDSRFTFSNFLDVAKVPYYMGGTFLALSFLAGGAKVNFARQAVGVTLYYLGVIAADKGINGFYKLKTGVDLDQKFRKANGDIEKVFASTDFPRFDMLETNDYRHIMRKLNVPHNVADPKREVHDQVRDIISTSRVDKLVLGNILAAVGAGYIARSDKWARLLQDNGQLKALWNFSNKQEGGLGRRLAGTADVLKAKVAPALKEAFYGVPGESPWFRRSILGGSAALIGLIFLHGWQASSRKQKDYQSPFITNLSPALAPEQSLYTAALQQNLPGGQVNKLPRKGVFEVAQRMESGFGDNNEDSLLPRDETLLPRGGTMINPPTGGAFR